MYNLDMLFRDIDTQETALFIGAGASRCHLMPIHQLPDGNEMKMELYKYYFGSKVLNPTLKKYEKKFKIEFKIKDKYIPPEMVWEKCLAKHGEELTPYFRLLNEMFGKGKYTPPNYKFIAWLNLMENKKINQIITTNFDEKIEDAYRLLQQRGLFADKTVLTAADDEDFDHFSEKIKETTIIYKLHGTISKPFTIISSITDMEKGLSKPKLDTLKYIFNSNSLIIFVGYACNDTDIFDALMKISDEDHGVKNKIVWVKRNPIKIDSNIYKILDAYGSKDNVINCESYVFLKEFFNHYVDREKISMDLIENHINFLNNIIKNNTLSTVTNKNKSPIPDVLYGEIDFPEKLQKDIFKIINSFDIQRLRDIRQLSFAQYRYPGATHTRFSHSLGVAYLVSLALTNPNLKDKVLEEDKRNTIFAALLHDVGHGPLGHVLDKFYDRLQKGNEHEKFTKKFIDEGLIDLREVLKDVNMNFTEVKDRTVFKSNNNEELQKYADKLFLAWLITDYALDLDRIDFLMRDLLMTQYKCQSKLPNKIQQDIVTQEHLLGDTLNDIIKDFISRLSVGTVNELDEAYKSSFPENARILYIDNKGVYDLDELLAFLLGIYTEMYSSVYYNDIVSCAEVMMAKALHLAYDAGDIDRSNLYTFTDSELYSYLENLENDLIREIVYSVKYRRFFKPIVEFDLDLPEEMHAVEIEKRIAVEFNLDQNEFKSLVIVNLPRKKELKNLFVKRKDKIILYQDISKFSNKLSNIQGKIFIHPENKIFHDNDLKKIKKLINFLKKMGINAKIVSDDKKIEHKKTMETLDRWFA